MKYRMLTAALAVAAAGSFLGGLYHSGMCLTVLAALMCGSHAGELYIARGRSDHQLVSTAAQLLLALFVVIVGHYAFRAADVVLGADCMFAGLAFCVGALLELARQLNVREKAQTFRRGR